MRAGSIPAIRARPYVPSVVIPACAPVRLIAATPSAWSAMETSVALWCSPVARSMSSSRGSGSSVMAAARARSSSVVSPMAETTMHRSAPSARARAILRATRRIRSAFATDEPPNFMTTMGCDIGPDCTGAPGLRPRGRVEAASRRHQCHVGGAMRRGRGDATWPYPFRGACAVGAFTADPGCDPSRMT